MRSDEERAAAIRDPEGGWLRSTTAERLLELAPALLEASDELSAAGRAQEALSAAVAAAGAYRVLLDQESAPAFGGVDVGLLTSLTRQIPLLVATGRTGELPRLTEVVAEAEQLMNERAQRIQQAVQQQLDGVNEGFVRVAALERAAAEHLEAGRYAEAEAAVAGLLAATEATGGGPDALARPLQLTAAAVLELGADRAALGQLSAALPELQRALTIMARVHGESHPRTAGFATDIAMIVHRAGDLPRAQTLLETAVALAEAAGGEASDQLVRALTALAEVSEARSDRDAAAAARQRLAQR